MRRYRGWLQNLDVTEDFNYGKGNVVARVLEIKFIHSTLGPPTNFKELLRRITNLNNKRLGQSEYVRRM